MFPTVCGLQGCDPVQGSAVAGDEVIKDPSVMIEINPEQTHTHTHTADLLTHGHISS